MIVYAVMILESFGIDASGNLTGSKRPACVRGVFTKPDIADLYAKKQNGQVFVLRLDDPIKSISAENFGDWLCGDKEAFG